MEEPEDYQTILGRLAPCGVDCGRCTWYVDGRVKRGAEQLQAELEGFERLAERVAGDYPVLASYPEFAAVLDALTKGSCTGCRAGGSSLHTCAARVCFREKGVDFCFQCDEYPCSRMNSSEELERHWRTANDSMKEIGVDRFFRESRERPRY